MMTEPDSFVDIKIGTWEEELERVNITHATPEPQLRKRKSGKLNQFYELEEDKDYEQHKFESNISEAADSSYSSIAYNFDDDLKEREKNTEHSEEKLLLNERKISQVTVQAYFDDPMLPYRMREVMIKKENKQLLRHYEHSLPSW
jgi:hypothetical protein